MSYDIEVRELDPQPALSIAFRCEPAEIGERLGDILPRVAGFTTQEGGEPNGPPFVRYHSVEAGECELDAGIPLVESIEGKGDIESTELPGGAVATLLHVGRYDDIFDAHDALKSWIMEHDWYPTGPLWHSYVSNPAEADPGERETRVYCPVESA